MKIYISAGHGVGDPGAVANNTNERDEVAKIVDHSIYLLKQNLPDGFEIIHVPNELNLKGAIDWINKDNLEQTGNICIEIHLNSNVGTPGTGTETWYGEPNLANLINNKIVEVLKLKNRGIKNGNHLGFNKYTKPASCLVEMGFINNQYDLQTIRSEGAEALIAAIENIISIYKTKPEPNPENCKEILKETKEKLQRAIENLTEIKNNLN